MEAWIFEAIGTRWEILTDTPLSRQLRQQISQEIADFDNEWSRFRSDSSVMTLSRQGGSIPLPADTPAMLHAYSDLSVATAGAVNPLVGDLLASRGYDAAYTFQDNGAVTTTSDWTSLLSWDEQNLTAHSPVHIDVGALGKGRLVDKVSRLLNDAHNTWVVDASGDLRTNCHEYNVGLEDPTDPGKLIGVWQITDRALCASATNRRRWGSLHHIFDARTGEPTTAVHATWVVASDAMTADALATALFFDGGPQLAQKWRAEWVRILSDGSIQWSPHCTAKVFS